ncbi:MAG: RloB family protein [Acidithiobacillus ferriphilus]
MMARISKLRGINELKRRPGQKPPQSIILIVCEGETEQEYFKAVRTHYRLTGAEVVIAKNTKGSAPISVVECAEEKCAEPGGYDRVYCVFDRDEHESFARARSRIRSLAGRKRKPLPIEEAISIPCFEFWVLLHYEQTDSPSNRCDEMKDRVRRHISDYQKADAATARRLMDKLAVALNNASWLENRGANNNNNPYTSVHKTILHLSEVARQS